MAVNLTRRWNSFRAVINKRYSNSGFFTIEKVNWSKNSEVKIGLPAVREEILEDPFLGIIVKQLKKKELGQGK
jgi:hypothetical protein